MIFDFFKKQKENKLEEKVEIAEPIDYEKIAEIAYFFKKETGITFEKQMSILKNKLLTFCRQREIHSFSKLLQTIESDAQLKQELIDYLTTNETFFYREFLQIQELVSLVKNSNNDVEILCAPSATGEEPYSIAIALLEAGISARKFKITGIDISSYALEKAQKAVYRRRNIRNLSEQIIACYFHEKDGLFTLKNSVTSLVTFKIMNIFDESFKTIGKFDFIFSRNMLIYFDKETKQQAKIILESLRKDTTQKVFFGHADLF